jgi:hypothetical protein
VWPLLRSPFDAVVDALEPILAGPRPLLHGAWLAVSLVVSWYVYVPIHELLHALGCMATGGTVTTLEVQTQYGGAVLARLFPFVVAGGEYAGRLSDFDTHGSDLVYLATDALPYALSIAGVPLIRIAARRSRPGLLGPGFVLGLAPFYNLPGDYFEMGSIVVTGLSGRLGVELSGLRSDDVFRLVGQIFNDPGALGLLDQGAGGALAIPLAAVAVSLIVALVFAYATWWLGERLARLVSRRG